MDNEKLPHDPAKQLLLPAEKFPQLEIPVVDFRRVDYRASMS